MTWWHRRAPRRRERELMAQPAEILRVARQRGWDDANTVVPTARRGPAPGQDIYRITRLKQEPDTWDNAVFGIAYDSLDDPKRRSGS